MAKDDTAHRIPKLSSPYPNTANILCRFSSFASSKTMATSASRDSLRFQRLMHGWLAGSPSMMGFISVPA
jgi:hypothetical protein